MSCHGSVKCAPYQLVYGQEAVMPWEISIGSRRVALQDQISADEYSSLMNVNTEDLTELRLWALEKIKESKAKVARAYNKKISRSEILSRSWCC